MNDNDELLPRLTGKKASWREVLTFCQNFRIIGIGELFLTGTSTELHKRLHQSGRAFAACLQWLDENSKRTGRALPFFDAVASGDVAAATEIARSARHSHARGAEYEEDFLFVEFCMQHFCLGASTGACEALLDRYERALEGDVDVRLALCRALLKCDAKEFEKSLERFLDERKDFFDELAANDSAPEESLATEGYFSVEGLALVRFAEQKGLRTKEDYLHVPSSARELSWTGYGPDSWKDLEL